jgi:hypothetical protein
MARDGLLTNQSFTVSPQGDRTVERGETVQFTFSGITSDTVDIALFDCGNVSTDENGTVTFTGSNPGGSGNTAQAGTTEADITVVNGVATAGNQHVNDAASGDGDVSFTVSTDSTTSECFVAVVFDDADDDNLLDLAGNGEPTEAFGVSGDVNTIAVEAQDNATLTNVLVDSVDKDANRFSSTDLTFYYDANDEYLLLVDDNGTPGDTTDDTTSSLDMAEFEARISAGDTVSGNYRSDSANQSTFTLNDAAPAASGAVGTQPGTGDNEGKQGLEVTIAESTTPSAASYDVFRATATQPTITGQTVQCPTIESGQYNRIGSVADDNLGAAGGDTFEFFDATAQPPAEGSDPADPQYCYYVVTVDGSGDQSAPSEIEGPAQAFQAAPPAAADNPTFTGATAAANTITVQYSELVDCTTVAADGSDFTASYTQNNNTTANNPTVAACNNVDPDGTGPITDLVGEVTLTVPNTQPADSTVVVRATTGTDDNTVGDQDDPQEFQVVGDAVQTTAS